MKALKLNFDMRYVVTTVYAPKMAVTCALYQGGTAEPLPVGGYEETYAAAQWIGDLVGPDLTRTGQGESSIKTYHFNSNTITVAKQAMKLEAQNSALLEQNMELAAKAARWKLWALLAYLLGLLAAIAAVAIEYRMDVGHPLG